MQRRKKSYRNTKRKPWVCYFLSTFPKKRNKINSFCNMNTREKILEAVLKNQPQISPLPDITMFKGDNNDTVQKYMYVFKTIGGSAYLVDDIAAVKTLI